MRRTLSIEGAKNITIGNDVYIGKSIWLGAKPNACGDVQLSIDDGCCIGNFNHIYATNSITIEKNVLIADKVYISDNLHDYSDITVPIMEQAVISKKKIVIGSGSWLGENVCVIGVNIGKNCVIGANSVVTHDIPDYCVAAGVPARIIKRFSLQNQRWEIVGK